MRWKHQAPWPAGQEGCRRICDCKLVRVTGRGGRGHGRVARSRPSPDCIIRARSGLPRPPGRGRHHAGSLQDPSAHYHEACPPPGHGHCCISLPVWWKRVMVGVTITPSPCRPGGAFSPCHGESSQFDDMRCTQPLSQGPVDEHPVLQHDLRAHLGEPEEGQVVDRDHRGPAVGGTTKFVPWTT